VKKGYFLHRDFTVGQMSQDMTLFIDDDEKAYHIHASENNQALHISELSNDYTSFTNRYIRIFPGEGNQAPVIIKENNSYYLISSGNFEWKSNPSR